MSHAEILFLAHRLPFPPDRGDRIRAHHLLKALAAIAPVHVGCMVDSRQDLVHAPGLARLAASHCIVERAKPLWQAGLEALWRDEPVSLAAWRSPQLSQWVAHLLSSGRIGAIVVFSGQMGQFVPAAWQGPLVVDLCDVDSAKFEAYAATAAFPRRWLHAREGRLLAGVEAGLAARADHTLLVSEAEAALFAARAPQARDIRALGNGIDAATFAPEGIVPAPAMAGAGPQLLFTGQMDYPPNVAAVRRMAQRIMPQVLARHPAAEFHVVGRAPVREVMALDGVNGTRVHGSVPDMRPFLAAADIVVAPLVIARGVQNKVLEAMAMARAVVLSPEAATGIAAEDGAHFLIAGDDAQFAAAINALASDPARRHAIGSAARALVVERQSWPAMLAGLPDLLGLPGIQGEGARHAA